MFAIKPLSPATWPDFAALVERHNGVWGGCWCMAFHEEGANKAGAAAHRAGKLGRVEAGTTHAALVYAGDTCVGWCQFGPTAELPRIKHGKAYAEGLVALPDWRITCFFADKAHRRQGVAAAALNGAVAEIARLGGGTVESYPEDTEGRSVSSSFLHNGNLRMFELAGFARQRKIGKDRWVVTRLVPAAE